MINFIIVLNALSLFGMMFGLAWGYVVHDVRGSILTLITLLIYAITNYIMNHYHIDEDEG